MGYWKFDAGNEIRRHDAKERMQVHLSKQGIRQAIEETDNGTQKTKNDNARQVAQCQWRITGEAAPASDLNDVTETFEKRDSLIMV